MFILEFIAVFACASFFGAAFYISMAQHPAAMQSGVPFAATFFPHMYHRAAPLQIALAVTGTVAGLIQWWLSGDLRWLIGAGCLVFVIPFTIIWMAPINNQLLNRELELDEATQQTLLQAWSTKHWVRSASSGAGFTIYLWACAQ